MRTLIRFSVPAGLAALVLMSGPRPVAGQAFSSYATFQSLPAARLPGLQIKLSYLGPQRRSVVTHLMIASTSTAAVHQFTPFRRPSYGYGTDDDTSIVLPLPMSALRAILDSVATVPGVTDGGVDAVGRLSYAMVDTVGGTIGFESIVDLTNGRLLFARLAAALASEPGTRRALEDLACMLDMRPTAIATNVSGSTDIALSGVRYDHLNDVFVGRMRLLNTGATALASPISVVLDGLLRVHVVNASGATCRALPYGAPYIDLLSAGSLAPGDSVVTTVRFANPALDPIELQTRVLAGAGSR